MKGEKTIDRKSKLKTEKERSVREREIERKRGRILERVERERTFGECNWEDRERVKTESLVDHTRIHPHVAAVFRAGVASLEGILRGRL